MTKKMSRHKALAMSLVGGAALLLTACAGQTTAQTSPAQTAAVVATTSSQAPAATSGTTGAATSADSATTAAEGVRLEFVSGASQASYRVQEQLAGNDLPNEAEGTTQGVSGSIVLAEDGSIDGKQSSITVDLTSLTSDQARRDNYVKQNTLQTDQYPTATFIPTAVRGLSLPLPTDGAASFQLSGDLTVHGVTKPVTWDVTALFNGQDVTGSATTVVALTDFGMTPPKIGPVLSIEDQMSLHLDFKAASEVA